jgi:hypothetical protein
VVIAAGRHFFFFMKKILIVFCRYPKRKNNIECFPKGKNKFSLNSPGPIRATSKSNLSSVGVFPHWKLPGIHSN